VIHLMSECMLDWLLLTDRLTFTILAFCWLLGS